MTIENAKPADIAAVPNSNLSNSNELVATTRDVTAEARAQGHFKEASTHIPNHVFNNNPDVVIRDGFRVHVGGQHRPNDIVMINGVEMEYEMAQSIGAIHDGEVTSPQDVFAQDSENTLAQEVSDDRPAEAVLLGDQLALAFGDTAPDVLELVGADIIQNGEVSEHGLEFFQRKMKMSPQQARETFDELEGAGSRVLQDFLNNGDGYEIDRVAFLADLAETGTRNQKETVREIWFKAATGQISRDAVIDAFDSIVEPYA